MFKGKGFKVIVPFKKLISFLFSFKIAETFADSHRKNMRKYQIRAMSTQVLGQLGYQVTTAGDGQHALEIFSSGSDQFDLLITDYTMPGLTGIDLIREIRSIRSNIPAILCSGFAEKLTENTAMELGVELILKPFGIKDLSQMVRRVLDARLEA
ncbi:MAG: response regulator [Syntrophobacteraceae bacterium]